MQVNSIDIEYSNHRHTNITVFGSPRIHHRSRCLQRCSWGRQGHQLRFRYPSLLYNRATIDGIQLTPLQGLLGHPLAAHLSEPTATSNIEINTHPDSDKLRPVSLADVVAASVTDDVFIWVQGQVPRNIPLKFFHTALERYLQPFSETWLSSFLIHIYLAQSSWGLSTRRCSGACRPSRWVCCCLLYITRTEADEFEVGHAGLAQVVTASLSNSVLAFFIR